MPELPEVETVKRRLKEQILNKKINSVIVNWDNIIVGDIIDFKNSLKGQVINDINRRGKWLIFELDNYDLLSHLRMEGKFFLRDNIEKHDYVIFNFTDKTKLIYNDVRKFGKMQLIKKGEDNKTDLLGVEPLSDDLSLEYLKGKFKNNNNKVIKKVLMDQSVIAGIGNIYASEILFSSKINPYRKASTLSEKEINSLIKNTKEIISLAVEKGGSTINSYLAIGEKGEYQNYLKVYKKEYCPLCNEKLKKEKIDGRTTYYCDKCQK